jgi:hypothetical protein
MKNLWCPRSTVVSIVKRRDWRCHKTECRKLQARKSLNRAALLLQAIIYQIRMYTTTIRITSVHVEGTTIYLHESQLDPSCPRQMKPFPIHLFDDRSTLLWIYFAVSRMVHVGPYEYQITPEGRAMAGRVTVAVTSRCRCFA